jgi:hypothetical protein
MPLPNGADGFDFTDAPGGDTNLDDIFVNPEVNTGEGTSTEEQQTGTPSEPFLKTATGTVYKTADDAVKGIEHKDAYIADLRRKLAEAEQAKPTQKTETAPTDESYTANPDKYFKDMSSAKTREEALGIQRKFIEEQLSPYAPVIAGMAKSRAVEDLSRDIPTIRDFIGSEDYNTTLDKYPLLKQSIQMAEGNPQLAGNLAQLYRMAFTSSAGENLSRAVPATREVVEARPTVSSTTTPPPATSRGPAPSMGTSDGRKATMQELEQKGVLDVRF